MLSQISGSVPGCLETVIPFGPFSLAPCDVLNEACCVVVFGGGGVECCEWDPLPSEVRCVRVLISTTNGSFVTADLTSPCTVLGFPFFVLPRRWHERAQVVHLMDPAEL